MGLYSFNTVDMTLETGKRVKLASQKPCERCGIPIKNQHSKRFCGPCADINTTERKRALYLAKKAQK